jgi:F-type H+-transporting ATPase subunit b
MARIFSAVLLGALLFARASLAQNAAPQHPPSVEHPGPGGPPHGAMKPHAGEGEGHTEGGKAEHAEHAEHDENGPPENINWWHGLLGTKEGVEPSLAWRTPEEPPPFLASLINFGLLVLIVVRFGKKPISDALVKRKDTIMREIDDAQRLRKAAEQRLGEYEARLAKIGEELERVRREFREQGERDKERLVVEAKERRERMQKDTELLLSQEAKQLRQDLMAEISTEAARLAADMLGKGMTLGDHDRFAEAFLTQLRARGPVSTSRKGGAS